MHFIQKKQACDIKPLSWADRGGILGNESPHCKITKNIGFLSNTGPDPIEITKIPNQHSMLDHCWRVDGGPIIVVFVWILSPFLSPL